MKLTNSLILMLSLALSACATNPVTGKSDFALVSESEEIKQGSSYHPQIIAQYGVYEDPALQQYVNSIGQELAAKSHRAHLKFTFTVLDSPEINAFALPGGYIYITRGIMAYLDSKAELAGVIGHEIGHVTARHSVRQQSGQMVSGVLSVLISATTGVEGLGDLSNQLGTGILRGYGREHELEADRLGAEYLHLSGYDPEVMLEVIGVLKDQEIYEQALAKKENRDPNIYHGVYSTHPRNDDRLKTVVRAAKNLSVQDYRDNDQSGYYGKIDGMVWGPSIKQGILVDNRFTHPDLAFALQLPDTWKADNFPEFLQARNPQTGAIIQIGVTSLKKDESLKGLLQRMSNNEKLKASKKDYGVTAKTMVKLRGGDEQPARISAIALDNSLALTLLGTSTKDQFAATDKYLIDVNQSFRRLSQQQIDAIEVPRLQILKRKVESFEILAEQSAIEYQAVDILRLLNRAFPDGDIRKIEKLKTVTYDH
jgi:predicted Zn-dependent protease